MSKLKIQKIYQLLTKKVGFHNKYMANPYIYKLNLIAFNLS
jgi:hypothetical protein